MLVREVLHTARNWKYIYSPGKADEAIEHLECFFSKGAKGGERACTDGKVAKYNKFTSAHYVFSM